MPSRSRFLMQQLIELRYNDWVPRREELTAKKLDDVHKEGAAKLGVSLEQLGLAPGQRGLAGGRGDARGMPGDPALFPMGPGSGLMPPPPPAMDDDGWEMSGKSGRQAKKERRAYEEAVKLYDA